MIELGKIREARERLMGVISPTPVVRSSYFSGLLGFECFFKLENLQKTGSFKVRGAYNKISSLSEKERSNGVITASSGNHAQGVAWAAMLLGIKSIVVMPEGTPIVKYMAARGYGAEVVFHGRSFDDSCAYAGLIAGERGLTFIPPFDDELVIAAQGTVGLEIIEAVPDVDAIVVPVGGGGLIAGIASAAKALKRSVMVIGVESEASMSCIESLKAGHPIEAARQPTIADGIAIKRVGGMTFPVIKELVDGVVAVGEESIAEAILKLLERKKLVVEGAGAVPVAAAMEGKLPKSPGKVVFVLSGGNIDVTALDRVIRAGLIKEGRVLKISTVLQDVPGSLAGLTAEIAAMKANILHVIHLREAESLPVGLARLEIILEVEGSVHSNRVLKALRDRGYMVS